MTGHRHEAMPLLLEGPTKASLGGLQYTSLAIVPVGLQAPQEAVFGQPALEVLSAHSLSSQRNYRTHLAGLYDIDRIVNMLYITIRQAPTRLPILFYEGSQKTTNQQLAILQRLESAQRPAIAIATEVRFATGHIWTICRRKERVVRSAAGWQHQDEPTISQGNGTPTKV